MRRTPHSDHLQSPNVAVAPLSVSLSPPPNGSPKNGLLTVASLGAGRYMHLRTDGVGDPLDCNDESTLPMLGPMVLPAAPSNDSRVSQPISNPQAKFFPPPLPSSITVIPLLR